MNLEVMKLDPDKVLDQARECYANISQRMVEFGVLLKRIRDEQLFSPDYDDFGAYCEKEFDFKKRKGLYLISIADAFIRYGLEKSGIDISKARVIAPHLTDANYKETLSAVSDMTVEEAKAYVKKVQVGKRFSAYFTEDEYYTTLLEALRIAALENGTDSAQVNLYHLSCEFLAEHNEAEILQGMHGGDDPVSLAVRIRDKWRCLNTNCGSRKNLERHSVTAPHGECTVDGAVTLCHDCHRKVTDEEAKVVLLKPGKIRYILKGGKK